MAVTVTFAGTPLTGSEPLSVAFTLTAEITPAVQGRGGEWTGKRPRRYPKPYHVYQKEYAETLREIPSPADDQTFDATIEAAAAINRVLKRMDDGDHRFDRMLRKFEDSLKDAYGFIASATVNRKIDETRNFILAAKQAEIMRLAKEEADERADLAAFIERTHGDA